MSGHRRLFFALWPEPSVRQSIQRVMGISVPPKARLTPVDNLHVTLNFLGEQPEELLPALIDVASDVRVAPFEMVLDHIEFWSRSKVMCLCPAQSPTEIVQLYAEIQRCMGYFGIASEQRACRPHVTLARKIRGARDVVNLDVPIIWSANNFVLVESILSSEGASYQVVHEFL